MRIISPILQAIGVVLAASVVVFAVQAALPGNPASNFIGPQPTLSAEAREQLVREKEVELGLDEPLPVQYAIWLKNAVRGDFGRNLYGGSVGPSVVQRLGPSLELALVSMIISIPIAILLAVAVVRQRRRGLWRVLNSVAVSGVVVPPFWLGLILVLIFSVWLAWLPSSGYTSFGENPIEHIKTLILPALTLSAAQIALYYRYIQQSLREAMQSQFVRTAHAKGVGERRIVYRHALPNSLLPALTLLGVNFGALIGGVVVVERIFNWPGIGSLLLSSVEQADYNTVTAIVLAVSAAYVVISAAVDVGYRIIDPRIRRA